MVSAIRFRKHDNPDYNFTPNLPSRYQTSLAALRIIIYMYHIFIIWFSLPADQIGALPPTWRDLIYLWAILGVGGFLVLLALIFVMVWARKAKVRKEQRFERRASLRSSIRSNKYAINNGALTQGSQTNIASSMYGSRSKCV